MTSRRDVIFQNGRARGKTPWSRLHFPRKDVNSATCNNYKAEEGYLNTHHSIIINESHVFEPLRSRPSGSDASTSSEYNSLLANTPPIMSALLFVHMSFIPSHLHQHDERDILPLDEGHRAATKFAFSVGPGSHEGGAKETRVADPRPTPETGRQFITGHMNKPSPSNQRKTTTPEMCPVKNRPTRTLITKVPWVNNEMATAEDGCPITRRWRKRRSLSTTVSARTTKADLHKFSVPPCLRSEPCASPADLPPGL
ncbi:uncharacterized protein LOC133645221 isoform X1 [Entelurus aequoreus]|uniref:uncharacterized protein LOC133645221 isoform X1 n=1 Tax=Entelurus aequoreus TaxID=161455 RepID=UPI002B1DC34D|nr:uncharacterized protein LOC133645221 isoform X1 [Entelurus aequoreus]